VIKVYQVNWRIPDGGQYIPPDSVGGGDYYRDKYRTDIIPATSIKMAREIVEEARPSAKVTKVKILSKLEV